MARLISWIRYVFLKAPYEGTIPQLYAATAKEIEEKDIRYLDASQNILFYAETDIQSRMNTYNWNRDWKLDARVS